MPTERLSMRRIRDLLRLKYALGLSDRAAALSLGLSKGTVGNYLARFSQAGLSWPLPAELDDDSLELLLFPSPSPSPSPTTALRLDRPVPDWAAMDVELRRPGVTRALLWEEYRARSPDGFGYAWFCEHFDAWKGRVRPTMRPGDLKMGACGRREGLCRFCGRHDRCDRSCHRRSAGHEAVRGGDGGFELHLCRCGGV